MRLASGMQLAQLAQKLRAGHVRHALIDQEQRDRRAAALQLARGVERLRRRLRGDDPVVLTVALPQIALDRAQHFVIVVDGQDDGLGHQARDLSRLTRWSGDAGSVTQNSVPPGPVCTSIAPWCRWTMRRAMSRPRPVPWPTSLVVKNGSKMRFAIVRRNARPVVDHAHDDLAVAGGGVDAHVAAGRRVDRVVDQIRPDLVQLAAVAVDRAADAPGTRDLDRRPTSPSPSSGARSSCLPAPGRWRSAAASPADST